MVSFTICILFPSNHEFAKGQAATWNHSLAIDPTLLTSSDAHPWYQFPLNKPFSIALLPPTTPSSLALANPVHPTQASSNVDQHNSACIVSKLFKNCLGKIHRRPQNSLTRCESASTPPLQGTFVPKNGWNNITVQWRSLLHTLMPFLQRN